MVMPPTLMTGVLRHRARAAFRRCCRALTSAQIFAMGHSMNRAGLAENLGHGFPRCPTLCCGECCGPSAQLFSKLWMVDQLSHGGGELARIVDFHAGALLTKLDCNRREVFEMRPGDDRAPHSRRLQNIMSAAPRQCSKWR